MNDDRSATLTATGGGSRLPSWLPMPGQILAGRFRVGRNLGAGGSGVVYAAHDLHIDQPVALKVLHSDHVNDPAVRERVRREVRASRSTHVNLTTVFDLYETESLVFLVMELVPGESLRELLALRHRLDQDEVIAIGRQLASALEHLHGRGLVHRDVKPGNVLLQEDGTAKLCDMGLVRPWDPGATITETAVAVGTPAYMAPEQITGQRAVAATDIYALGLTLHRALTGCDPRDGTHTVGTIGGAGDGSAHDGQGARTQSPRWLERLLRWMLRPAAADRPTAAQVRAVLDRRRLGPRPTRRLLWYAAASVIALVAVVLALPRLLAPAPETVQLDVLTREVVGRDARGKVTWHWGLDAAVVHDRRADLDGDGKPELILVTWDTSPSDPSSTSQRPSRFLILDREGRALADVSPEELVRYWTHRYPKVFSPFPRLLDLDGDTLPEVVLMCNHRTFYPAYLLVYWPKQQRWNVVAYNEGRVYEVAAEIVDSDTTRLQLLGVNNFLGQLPIFAEIELELEHPGPLENTSTFIGDLSSPPGFSNARKEAMWSSYLPLPPAMMMVRTKSSAIERLENAGVRCVLNGTRYELDRFRNPAHGPNAGQDVRPLRLAFLRELRLVQEQVTALAVQQMIRGIGARHAALLGEKPYRAVLGLVGSRALVLQDDLPSARELLERAWRDTEYEGVGFQLAQLEAVGGDLSAAISRLQALNADAKTTRASFDGVNLLLRLAIETRREDVVEGSIGRLREKLSTTARRVGVTSALRTRCRLWWDEVGAPDMESRSWNYAPAGRALAALARWRLGQTAADDAQELARAAELRPNAHAEFEIARSAVMIADGDGTAAASRLLVLIAELERAARTDFGQRQLLDLSRAVRIVALEACGETAQARREAAAVRASLTSGLLPANLVDEVLARLD